MNLFAVSFFGHREVDDPFVIEQQLESIVRELLHSKEYVEFLVGRDGEFDQLVSSTIRRCKRTIRDDNSLNFSLLLSIQICRHFYFPCLRLLLEKQFAQPPFQVDTDAPERRNSCSSDKVEPWDE